MVLRVKQVGMAVDDQSELDSTSGREAAMGGAGLLADDTLGLLLGVGIVAQCSVSC